MTRSAKLTEFGFFPGTIEAAVDRIRGINGMRSSI